MAVGAILRRTVPGRLTLRVVIVSHGHSSTYVARSDEYDGLHKPSMVKNDKVFLSKLVLGGDWQLRRLCIPATKPFRYPLDRLINNTKA